MKTAIIIILVVLMVACFAAAAVFGGFAWLVNGGFGWVNEIKDKWEGNKVMINQNKELDLTGVDSVKIYMQMGRATVRPAAAPKAALSGYVMGNADKVEFTTVRTGNELAITVKLNRSFLNLVVNELTLDVGLPADFPGKVSLEGATANLDIADMNVASFYGKAATGSVTANIGAGDISLETTTGSVVLQGGGRSYNSVKMHTTTGSIEAKDCTTLNFESRSTTGRTTLSGIDAQTLKAESTTGRIDMMGCSGAVSASAMTGTITAALKDFADCSFDATTGRVELTLPDKAFTLDARTTTGSINTDFSFMGEITGERKFSAGAEIKGNYNGGGSAIKIRTTTGNIQISKAK